MNTAAFTVLVVDDEKEMVELVSTLLKNEGYQVEKAYDGQEALLILQQANIDLIILDIMMPKIDGFEVCQQIRKKSHVPILMLTAKSRETDRIYGLKTGADDYVVKPFAGTELMARVEALLRRTHEYKDTTEEKKSADDSSFIDLGDLTMDVNARVVKVNDEKITLTRKEFEVLRLLVEHKGQVLSREQLLDHVLGIDYMHGTTRTVDTHIKTLRMKLKGVGDRIETVWGVGYKFHTGAV